MERILIGLPEFTIENVVSAKPVVLQVSWMGQAVCPHCGSKQLRIKDSFWRSIKNIPLRASPSSLLVKCHKYHCKDCNAYFNSRLPGVKKWSRTTELLKKAVFSAYNKGYSNKDIATENAIGVASVERFYHQMIRHKDSHLKNRSWPRILGIDEHRFTKKQGYLTTFCDLQKQRVFDIAKGKSSAELHSFLSSLKGRERVRIVCIDMNSTYRKMVKEWFPNAKIVADRFHVIRLVNHHFSKVCKLVDEEHIAFGRGGLMRMLVTRRDRLNEKQQNMLKEYFFRQPALASVYNFCHDLNDLLRIKKQNRKSCSEYVYDLLEKIKQLKQIPFQPLKTLGKTLESWQEEVACMFRFVKNNGITEGFHRKMKLIQRRAYGFRNFENYRLRVRVLCC